MGFQWAGSRVIVTGGHGFLGSRIVEKLSSAGAKVYAPAHSVVDLVDGNQVRELFRENCPEIVIHAAARVGGIGYNQEFPGSIFYENIMMGVQCMEEARRAGVRKFVAIGTICSYPKFTPVPFTEGSLWDGYPEETNAPYGLAKKAMLVQSQAYRRQYGFDSIFLMPVNLFGPGDDFDPSSSHVIPALIKKCVMAKNNGWDHVEVWGTGTPTREFLYVDDCADAIILAAEKYSAPDPVNVGAGFEVSIKDLAELIRKETGFQGSFIWNSSKPDGQPRRCLDVQKMAALGFRAKVGLEEGIRNTVAWYVKS